VPQPLYQKIAEDLENQIRADLLPEGSQLPTEDDLRTRYGASRNTVRDAVKRLTGKGLVETKPGQGTFVTKKGDPFVTRLTADPAFGVGIGEGVTLLSDVTAGSRLPSMSKPKVEVQTAVAEVTNRLRVPRGTQLISRHQERFIGDQPWSLQTSFYPMEFALRGAPLLLQSDDITEGAVAYLSAAIGLRQVGYRDWITARSPDSNEEAFFKISHDATVFEIFRTGFDQNGRPMRVTVTVFPTVQNQFIVNVGDLPDPRYEEESLDE
jgi:GntR family transcriptional regulator